MRIRIATQESEGPMANLADHMLVAVRRLDPVLQKHKWKVLVMLLAAMGVIFGYRAAGWLLW